MMKRVPGERELKVLKARRGSMTARELKGSEHEVENTALTQQLGRIGSPLRPMSARDAFRRLDRGVKVRLDTLVAPDQSWATRLGMKPAPMPLFKCAPILSYDLLTH
jgi:hypothetical protein